MSHDFCHVSLAIAVLSPVLSRWSYRTSFLTLVYSYSSCCTNFVVTQTVVPQQYMLRSTVVTPVLIILVSLLNFILPRILGGSCNGAWINDEETPISNTVAMETKETETEGEMYVCTEQNRTERKKTEQKKTTKGRSDHLEQKALTI